jgi:hypothetical protein
MFSPVYRPARHTAGCGLPCAFGGYNPLTTPEVHRPESCPRCGYKRPHSFYSQLWVDGARVRTSGGLDAVWADVVAGGSWTALLPALRESMSRFGRPANGTQEVRVFRSDELWIASWCVPADGAARLIVVESPAASEVREVIASHPDLASAEGD